MFAYLYLFIIYFLEGGYSPSFFYILESCLLQTLSQLSLLREAVIIAEEGPVALASLLVGDLKGAFPGVGLVPNDLSPGEVGLDLGLRPGEVGGVISDKTIFDVDDLAHFCLLLTCVLCLCSFLCFPSFLCFSVF